MSNGSLNRICTHVASKLEMTSNYQQTYVSCCCATSFQEPFIRVIITITDSKTHPFLYKYHYHNTHYIIIYFFFLSLNYIIIHFLWISALIILPVLRMMVTSLLQSWVGCWIVLGLHLGLTDCLWSRLRWHYGTVTAAYASPWPGGKQIERWRKIVSLLTLALRSGILWNSRPQNLGKMSEKFQLYWRRDRSRHLSHARQVSQPLLRTRKFQKFTPQLWVCGIQIWYWPGQHTSQRRIWLVQGVSKKMIHS